MDLKLPRYNKEALRPNPHTAEPARGIMAFAQGSVLAGDFGGDGAQVRPAIGLPKTTRSKAQGQDDGTAAGFIPSPGLRAPGWPVRNSQKPTPKRRG